MAYEDDDSREVDGFLAALDVEDELDITQELLGVVPAPSSDTSCAVGQAPSEGGSGELHSGEGPSHGPSCLLSTVKMLVLYNPTTSIIQHFSLSPSVSDYRGSTV